MESILQDENDIGLAGLNRPGMPLMGKGASAGSVLPGQAGFRKTPARKAFGNITNFKGAAGSTPAGKTPATAKLRRAFGDITNATPAQQDTIQAKTAAKPVTGPEATAAPQAEVPAHTVLEDAPEQLSGKGWLQQEQERLATRYRHFDTAPTSVIAPWAARHLALEDLSLSEWVRRQDQAGRLRKEVVPLCAYHEPADTGDLISNSGPVTLPEVTFPLLRV